MGVKLGSGGGGATVSTDYEPLPLPEPVAVASAGVSRAAQQGSGHILTVGLCGTSSSHVVLRCIILQRKGLLTEPPQTSSSVQGCHLHAFNGF